MSDALSVQCPKCGAKLKLKNRSAAGKKIPCPKCSKPFVVELPPDDDEFAALAEADEIAAEGEDDESEGPSRLPPARTGKSSAKKAPNKRRAGSENWKKPALVAGTVIVVLALLGGAGFLVYPLVGDLLSGNKIDMAWLPPDADTIVHARVADMWNTPFVKSMTTSPIAQGSLNFKEMFGLDPQEIRSLTIGAVAAGPGAGKPPGAASVRAMNPAGAGFPGMATRGGGNALIVLRTAQSFDPKEMQTRLRSVRTLLYQNREIVFVGGVAMAGRACFLPDSRTVVMGEEADVKAAIDRGPKAPRREDLDFIDAGPHLVIVVAPKDPAALESTAPSSPIPIPGVSNLGTALKGKVKGVCLGMTFGEDLDWSAAANCISPDAATEVSTELGKSLESAKSEFNKLRSSAPPQFSELVVLGDTILGSIALKPHGGVMEAKGKIPGSIKTAFDKLPALMMAGMLGGGPGGNRGAGEMQPGGPGAGFNFDGLASGPGKTAGDPTAPGQINLDPLLDAREAERQTRCKNNLKELGLAMHLFHDKSNSFPGSAIRDRTGKPLLSWRVAMLPYLNQMDLYNQFHLDEPWDSENNKKLIPLMPALFTCPGGKAAPGETCYLAVDGPGAMFQSGAGRKIAEVTDGTSNTILLVEADDSRAVTWTKPDDYTYDPANPLKGLVGHHPGGFIALTCDGAAHFIAETIDPALLIALFTRSGNEMIPPGVLN
jgi:hypothetical protein